MTDTQKITNEVYDRHQDLRSLREQIDNLPPLDALMYDLDHERPVQIQWMRGNWQVRRTEKSTEYSAQKNYWGERTLGPGPNRSGKRWPEEFRAAMTWFTVVVIVGVPGTALAMWVYAVSAAFRAFVERILSLFY